MSILNADYIVIMPDGKWKLSVEVIAYNRAKHYMEADQCTFDESLKDTIELFDEDDYEIEDWARNNMNWSDVVEHATRVELSSELDYQEWWVNGDVEIDPEDRDGV